MFLSVYYTMVLISRYFILIPLESQFVISPVSVCIHGSGFQWGTTQFPIKFVFWKSHILFGKWRKPSAQATFRNMSSGLCSCTCSPHAFWFVVLLLKVFYFLSFLEFFMLLVLPWFLFCDQLFNKVCPLLVVSWFSVLAFALPAVKNKTKVFKIYVQGFFTMVIQLKARVCTIVFEGWSWFECFTHRATQLNRGLALAVNYNGAPMFSTSNK